MKYAFSNYQKKPINDTMLEYFRNVEPLDLKYSVMLDGINFENFLIGKSLPIEIKAFVSNFEELCQYGSLNKQEYSYINDNLSLVYGDSDMVMNDISTYHIAEKKFIHQYISIPQLNKMFDEDYFNFEWDMHIGQNFHEHRNDYNRDHFTHQIRNMYMMLILLEKFEFYKSTRTILLDRNSGKISEYFSKKLSEFSYTQTPRRKVFEKIVEYEKSNTTKSVETEDLLHLYSKEYFIKYVIYASSVMAALFHDMGYPICHFLEQRHRISEYNPTMYMFTHNTVDSFDEIETKLENSLLFTIVSTSEIKNSLKIDEKKGKYNHGAYSAIAFLLQFYNNGTIHSLSVEKQCAIELAAVAIYNHTIKYNCIKESDNNYYQPIFRQNPISFLLRLCDDLQEWDRRYFEISKSPDLSVCKRCLAVLIPEQNEDDKKKRKIDTKEKNLGEIVKDKKTVYRCLCGTPTFRYDSFSKRKLYVVNTSKDIIVDTDSKDILHIYVDYDLYSLLKMSRVNNTYAKFRANDLNEVKLLVRDQNFGLQSDGELNFEHIYIDYFMTANPINIKIKILERFFESILPKEMNFEQRINTIKDYPLKDIFVQLELSRGRKNSLNSLYQFLAKGVYIFYVDLLIDALHCRQNGKVDSSVIEKYKELGCTDIYNHTISVLVEDCLLQYSKERDVNTSFLDALKREQYYQQFVPSEDKEAEVYNCIATYCNYENFFNKYHLTVPKKESKYPYVGYYQDLYFFDQLNRKNRS